MTLSIEEAAERLRAINREIHRYSDGVEIGTARPITDAEWLEVVELVTVHDFPCVLFPGVYGFVLFVHMASEVPMPDSERLLSLSNEEFSFPSAREGFAGQDETLKQLKPFVYRDRNQQLLAWYGYAPLADSIHSYSY